MLTVAEQILGPNVLPPNPTGPSRSLISNPGQSGVTALQPSANQSAAPAGRPKPKALLPKSLFMRSRPGVPAEPDPLVKYLPTNYPPGARTQAAPQAVAAPTVALPAAAQPVAAPAVAQAARPAPAEPSRTRSIFPLRFFAQQEESPPVAAPAASPRPKIAAKKEPTVATKPAVEPSTEIARPNLQPMQAAAPGTSLALPAERSEHVERVIVPEEGDESAGKLATVSAAPEAIDDSDWRPSKRRRRPPGAGKARVPKASAEVTTQPEPAAAESSDEQPSSPAEKSSGQAVVKLEKPAKPSPTVIVPLADPLPAAPSPVAVRQEKPAKSSTDSDTAAMGPAAVASDTERQSKPVAVEKSAKRRPVIIRPDSHDDAEPRRSHPVQIVRGVSRGNTYSSDAVVDEQIESDQDAVVVSATDGRSKSARTARGFESRNSRSNPLR